MVYYIFFLDKVRYRYILFLYINNDWKLFTKYIEWVVYETFTRELCFYDQLFEFCLNMQTWGVCIIVFINDLTYRKFIFTTHIIHLMSFNSGAKGGRYIFYMDIFIRVHNNTVCCVLFCLKTYCEVQRYLLHVHHTIIVLRILSKVMLCREIFTWYRCILWYVKEFSSKKVWDKRKWKFFRNRKSYVKIHEKKKYVPGRLKGRQQQLLCV